jgi:hypothetical protein
VDTYKFTIDDLNRAGINLRDCVSRVTAKAQKYQYQPLGRLWQPQGLFYELAREIGMMRKSEDGRIVVQAYLFHRAAALADKWFAGELSFINQEDGSQIVGRNGGMGEEDEVGGREDAGGRGGDDVSDQRRHIDAAPTTTTTTATTATTTLSAAAKAQHRTPLPTAGGSRRSSSAATSEATVGRQPATKAWTSINRPAPAPAPPAPAPTQTAAHSDHDAPLVRNPNTSSLLSSSASSSLKRHRLEHHDDDARDNDNDADADDDDAATPSDLKKRRQLRRPERERPARQQLRQVPQQP